MAVKDIELASMAGNGIQGFSGDVGPATSASLANPFGDAVDSASNLFIADRSNERIRRVVRHRSG